MRFVAIAVACGFVALAGCGDVSEAETRINSRPRDVAKSQGANESTRTGGNPNVGHRESPRTRDPVARSALREFDGSVKSGAGTSAEDTTGGDSLSKNNRATAKSAAIGRYEPKRKFSGFSVRMDSSRVNNAVIGAGRVPEEPETSEMFDELDSVDSIFFSTVSGADSQARGSPNAVDGANLRTDFEKPVAPTYSHFSGRRDLEKPTGQRPVDFTPRDTEGPVRESSRKSSQTVKNTIVRSEGGEPRDQAAGLRGIYNIGNTCYLNTLLQVLLHIEGVKEEMVKLSPEIDSQLMKGFLSVVNMEWTRGPPIRPVELVRVLMNKRPLLFTPGRQQDAHEGFSVLLQDISEELRRVGPDIDETVISLFQFDMLSQLSCDFKSWRTSSHAPENTLSVAIPQDPSPRGVGLGELVKEALTGEAIDGMESCGNNIGLKRLAVAYAPRVLIVYLKRALLNVFGGRGVRVDTKVKIDAMVNAESFLGVEDGANVLYRLKAIAHHSGHGEGGHWYADFQHSEDGLWYRASDDTVWKLVNGFESISSTATLIVYETIPN